STAAGLFYLGAFNDGDTRVQMRLLSGSPELGPGVIGENVLDVQDRGGGFWTIVLNNGLHYFDPEERQWVSNVTFDVPVSTFREVLNRGVVVANNGQIWLVADQTGSSPTAFTSYSPRAGDSPYIDGV